MIEQKREVRIITEADLPEVARAAAQYFGGLNLQKMLEIAGETVINGEFRVIEDVNPAEPNKQLQEPGSEALNG